MNKNEILAFLNANPACHMATVEGDKPRVRGMLMYRADETGVMFHTGVSKDLHAQLKANPNVELCFNNYEQQLQVRVSGRIEFVDDMDVKKEIVANRPFMKPWVDQHGYDLLVVFRVVDAMAHAWTLAANFAPKEYVRLT